MKVAVLGTGAVGRTLGGKIASLGHTVYMGTRDVDALLASTNTTHQTPQTFDEWHKANSSIQVEKFAEAASASEIAFNALHGTASLDVLRSASQALAGKILVDVSNPLDFSAGFPPSLSVCNTESLAEQIQQALPDTKVVKSLNTVTAPVMVDPSLLAGEHHIFVSGDDANAKAEVTMILQEWFGWGDVIDLGDITTARGAEMYLAIWLRLIGALGTNIFNIKIVR